MSSALNARAFALQARDVGHPVMEVKTRRASKWEHPTRFSIFTLGS